MIECKDATLLEADGYFEVVDKLMRDDNNLIKTWMIASIVYVNNKQCSVIFDLHFWHNKDIWICNTDRSFMPDASDEDVRELSEWCNERGWNIPYVNKSLLTDKRLYSSWHKLFLAQLVRSDYIEEKEKIINERLIKSYDKEQLEEQF